MQNLRNLADEFSMSKEATLRRSVELEHRPCAFLTLDVNKSDDEEFLTIKYPVHSRSFKEKIGQFNHNETFNKKHESAKILTDPLIKAKNEHTFVARLGKKKIELKAEVWFNGFNVFVFFQPYEKNLKS